MRRQPHTTSEQPATQPAAQPAANLIMVSSLLPIGQYRFIPMIASRRNFAIFADACSSEGEKTPSLQDGRKENRTICTKTVPGVDPYHLHPFTFSIFQLLFPFSAVG
jgi:hypothetical protein